VDVRAPALAFAQRERPRIVRELCELVRFPSVSSDPQRAPDVRRCAHWLAAQLERIGLHEVRVEPTARHPIVWARRRGPPGRPTVLIYGHYDVQPVEPLAAWRSPPFEPVVRDGALLGRGASDDKGQLFVHVKALEALLRTGAGPPVSVICAFEGSEEVGSPGFEDFVARHGDALRCDAVVISDTTMLGPRRPALIYGLRGSLSLEVTLVTGRQSVHSGTYGGAVLGAPQALAQLLARLYDAGGDPVVPNLDRGVRPVSRTERARLARAGPTDAQMASTAGAVLTRGPADFSAFERTTVRPALVVTSLQAGYQGPGFQATIRPRASARLNVRLVPDQRPAEVERALRAHLQRLAPPGTRCEVRAAGGEPPVLLPRDHPAMAAAARAYRAGFGASPALVRSGGTIGVVEILHRRLDVPVVLMGFALRDDRHHAPNERFRLASLFGGIATSIHFLCELGSDYPRPVRRSDSSRRRLRASVS
jgi:acetylornithine deacetylase/succinyl-diaminopimelate desuccinylase-like protein